MIGEWLESPFFAIVQIPACYPCNPVHREDIYFLDFTKIMSKSKIFSALFMGTKVCLQSWKLLGGKCLEHTWADGGLGVDPPWTKKIDKPPWTILDPAISWRKKTLRFFWRRLKKSPFSAKINFKNMIFEHFLPETLNFSCFFSVYPICVPTRATFYCEMVAL